jgi:hypothetical protein
MHHLRVTAVLAIALAVVVVGALAGCSRKALESSTDTTTGTTVVGETTTVPPPPSSDTTAPPVTDSTPVQPDELPDGAFGHPQAVIDEFRRIYSEAFTAECTRIWGHANADGSLADPDLGDPYYVSDCLEDLDPDWGELADSNDEAFQLGVDDAQIAASDRADPLCNAAGVCWSYGD